MSRINISFASTKISPVSGCSLDKTFPVAIIELEKSLIYSDGNLGESIHILESEIITDDNFDDFQIWMRLCYSVNIQEQKLILMVVNI